jgi:DNA primase
MEGRARFASLALNHIKQLPAGIFQGMMITELGKRSRVDVNELKAQANIQGETQPSQIMSTDHVDTLKDKLPAPMRLAFALLVQQPSLVDLIHEPLPESVLPGAQFFARLLGMIKNHSSSLTTGRLLEMWRGEKEESFIAKLAHFEHHVPEAAAPAAFLGSLRQMQVLTIEEEINRLMAKAAQEGLTEKEKHELHAAISHKKSLSAQPIQLIK